MPVGPASRLQVVLEAYHPVTFYLPRSSKHAFWRPMFQKPDLAMLLFFCSALNNPQSPARLLRSSRHSLLPMRMEDVPSDSRDQSRSFKGRWPHFVNRPLSRTHARVLDTLGGTYNESY
ncbi:hypothetical protein Tco_0558514 [Tanacetum coccineum]